MPPIPEEQSAESNVEAAAPVSIRDSLAAAFDAVEAGEGEATAPAPAASAAAPATPKPAAPAAPVQGAARDEQGRFAKGGEPAQSPNSQPSAQTAASGEAQSAPIAPPAGWSATAKAKFSALDPDVQREVLKREGEMDQGRAQWQQGAERLNRLDAVLRPRQEQFRLAGIDDVRAVETLFAAQDFLNRDPVEALIYLGRQSGVNWNAFVQRLSGQPAPQGQQQAQRVNDPIANQVQQLTQWATQQQRAAEQGQQQQHLDQVRQFASDPSNLYFENVKGRMSQLIRSGAASDLKDAYDQACWADPEVRGLLLSAQDRERLTQTQAAGRAKVAQARQASGSITGSPSPGSTPGAGGPRPKSIRDALDQAWDAVA